MNLHAIGLNFRTAPVEIRERLAFTPETRTSTAQEIAARFGCEVVILSTCNRVEMYIGRPFTELDNGGTRWSVDTDLAAELLSEVHKVPAAEIRTHLYNYTGHVAILHLCRVTSSLDSLIVGEGQIAGQVKEAFEHAQTQGTTGPLMNILFPHALRAAKRVRTETGIAHGHVSVSSVAVDYVKQVFDHFGDKTVLVIGAGKMGRLTLKHLEDLHPGRILVTNRSPEKAQEVAAGCGGTPVPWAKLDEALAEADIALSTTGAGEPIMTAARYEASVRPRRKSGTLVVLDIAVPRDFDPDIHDGDSVCVFNIDDLTRVREQTLAKRQKHVAAADAIVEHEVARFLEDWTRRRSGPVIKQLRTEVDRLRNDVVTPLLDKLNGKLSPEDKAQIEGAFRLFQNKVLHGPMAALQEASREGHHSTLMDALKKLFRLGE